ncbi:hypothetical protein [Bacillus cereus]|uniref:Exosporium leader peptide n=1 Tax=Bacillus cereus TaxID=1396 RepID=A0AAW5L2H1_BACCE|nr:hypothetical protein [Bacillus cereus]MCQ6288436.1 hypothetical protein [Bacillus cereus]MCQ6306509.1 hypothetical protein [Bacillus cereus]MCQ6317588.1 hypothetical protein [Bacillus cereus]MCQ6328562.1 hypothetical protein [Bacillus cereus]MCQ6385557.1 hypothetical protein [Bacillus cereus]
MSLLLTAFTTPANTLVIADTAAPPGSLPTPAVFTTPSPPLIDGNNEYIWSPNNESGQIVTFQTDFPIGGLPITVAVGLAAFYSFAANETANVTASLQVLNAAGIIVTDTPLFTGSNGGNPDNITNASGDALIQTGLLTGETARIRVTAIVTAPITLPYEPANTGRYLGEIIVRDIVGI